jgi:glycyl-tRNA synthetase beta chain
MAAELLFEIGTEEIPAGFLARALAELPGLARARLAAARLEHGEIVALGAPRRLALSVAGLADRQADLAETLTGPPASAAFDKDGKPTRAAAGFAQKVGVPVESLTVVEVSGAKGKAAYVAARREVAGRDARALLPALLVELAREIPWKKSMRWANLDEAFVRPVHWIVALHGGEVVPLEMFGVRSGRETRGHRFLAPGAIALDGTLAGYTRALRQAFVLVDPAARRTEIEAELARVAKDRGAVVKKDDDLLAEVVNLVEYPKAVVGSFDERHLEIPAEVIISAMRGHQRYFATEEGGRLANRFVTIAGTITRDLDEVRRGNERVLAARLADARFFFDEDRRTPLEAMAAKLSGVAFIKGLGTMSDKAARVAAFAGQFPSVDPARFRRAAALCKADLVSKVVGEFPDLQGVMGGHYARLGGEEPEVAAAIVEHYLPRGASDRLPASELGAALGIADRLDTLAGCFRLGLMPSGSNDPYGLRRAALAVLNVLIDRDWHLPLSRLVEAAGAGDGAGEILAFLSTRLRGVLVDGRGLAGDCVDAALAAGLDDVPDAVARAVAVAHLRDRPDFEPLGVAFKRVANIIKGEEVAGEPDAARFGAAEGNLWKRFLGVRAEVERLIGEHSYDAALREIATLKPAIDKFFEDVLVMDPDLQVRANRLRLLGSIARTFIRIADFRQLAVK